MDLNGLKTRTSNWLGQGINPCPTFTMSGLRTWITLRGGPTLNDLSSMNTWLFSTYTGPPGGGDPGGGQGN
jgi:hypothetical protein